MIFSIWILLFHCSMFLLCSSSHCTFWTRYLCLFSFCLRVVSRWHQSIGFEWRLKGWYGHPGHNHCLVVTLIFTILSLFENRTCGISCFCSSFPCQSRGFVNEQLNFAEMTEIIPPTYDIFSEAYFFQKLTAFQDS